MPSTHPIIFTLPLWPWVLLAPYFCWYLQPLLPSSPSSYHSLSPLQRTCNSPPSLSFSFFFYSSSGVSFFKGCPGRLARTKTVSVCTYTCVCVCTRVGNIPPLSGVAEMHCSSLQSERVRSGRAHSLGDVQDPTTEAGEKQWLGTEAPGEPDPASQQVPCPAVSVCSPVPRMAPAWEIKLSGTHVGQPISLPLIFQNWHFPDNFSLLCQLIPRAGGNSVFSLNAVIQYCVELHTYSQRENQA